MDFYETMQKLGLARQPCWTISDNLKRPIDPRTALKQHFNPETYQPALAKQGDANYWGNLCNDPVSGLVSLNELENDPGTPKTGYALRVDTQSQNVLLVDIERDYDHKLNPLIRDLPILYAERSRHGGMHLIVKVEQVFLDDPVYEPILLKGSYKIAGTNDHHSGVEVFTASHYLTFTTNQIEIKHEGSRQGLMRFLDYISKHETTEKVENLDFSAYSVGMPMMLAIARLSKNGLSDRDLTQIEETARLYNDPKFAGDDKHKLGDKSQSRRDYMIVLSITFKLLYQLANNYRTSNLSPNDELFFTDSNHNKPNNDLKFSPIAISKVIQTVSWKYLKKRAKLTQKRSSTQTYHQLVVSEALGYALTKSKVGKQAKSQMRHHGYLKEDDHNGN